MLKLLGAGCLVTASILLGERQAKVEQQALATIDAFLVSFTTLESEIAYLASDLVDAFHRAGKAAPQVGDFYQAVITKVQTGEQVGDAWQKALREWGRSHRLTQHQRSVIENLASAWGPWRAEDHVRHIRLAKDLLQSEQQAAREKLDGTCRLWRYLGVGGGLILTIILS